MEILLVKCASRYVYGSFVEHHQTTIGVDFSLKAATVNGTTVRVQLWDIAGDFHKPDSIVAFSKG